MNIKDHLMTTQEYNSRKWEVPYTYKLSNGRFSLFYFGANHSFDPNNEQYEELNKMWKEYVSMVKKKDEAIIIAEGGEIRKVFSDDIEAIKMASETGYINQKAKEDEIEVIGAEPNPSRIIDALLEKFTKDEIAYYYFARDTMQWASMPTETSGKYEDFIEKYLGYTKQNFEWNDFDFTLENLKSIHTRIFDKEFHPSDKSFFYNIVNPTIESSIINEVARECSFIRNVLITEKILGFWDKADVFVVYGFSHAVIQKPVFEVAQK